MFTKVKEYFKNRPPFHRKLASTSLLSNTNEIILDDLLFLISCFENNNSQFLTKIPAYYMKLFFDLVFTEEFSQHFQIRSKILLTCHLILHEFQIGIEFAEIFLQYKANFLLDPEMKSNKFKDQVQQSQKLLTLKVQIPYFQYLQRLAINIQVFHSCKVQQYPIMLEQQQLIDIQTKLIWLFKISNLANCGLGQIETLKEALISNPKDTLLKEIVLVYWSDTIVYYNFLSKEVLSLLEYYRHMAANLCLQFYELYLSLFQIRNSIKNLYKYKNHFDRDNVIRQPKWFDVTRPTHKYIEEYMIKQRLEQTNLKKGLTQTDRETINHKEKKTKLNQKKFEKLVKFNLSKIKSLNEEEILPDGQDKAIQTHRASREQSDAGEDFEELKKILSTQNLQERLNVRKQETNQKLQASFSQQQIPKQQL